MEDFNRVIALVANEYGVTVAQIKSDRKAHNLVKARVTVSSIMRKLHGMSLPLIGALLGGKDHTTIIHHIRLHEVFANPSHRRYSKTYLENYICVVHAERRYLGDMNPRKMIEDIFSYGTAKHAGIPEVIKFSADRNVSYMEGLRYIINRGLAAIEEDKKKKSS